MKGLTSIVIFLLLPLEILVRQPTINYNIIDHPATNAINNFYFNRLPRLWNALPVIDPALDTKVIKFKLTQYLWCNFNHNFSPDNTCTYSFICIHSKCSQLPIVNNYHKLDSLIAITLQLVVLNTLATGIHCISACT